MQFTNLSLDKMIYNKKILMKTHPNGLNNFLFILNIFILIEL